MAERCLACAVEMEGTDTMHPVCARALFGRSRLPDIEVDPDQLHLFGQAMAGHTTISGVQSKLSLGWHQKTLRVRAEVSAFILKPQSTVYRELPENEHACLGIARLCGLEVSQNGLVPLSNGSRALVIRRFDRDDGRRIPMEDFAQLAGKLPREKYTGSSEACANIVRSYSSSPGADMLRLYRQFLVAWWIGNGDLHLKNLALLTRVPGNAVLSPVYDMLSTQLVIPNDPLALPIVGKKSNLGRKDWLAFAAYCELPQRLAVVELDRLRSTTKSAVEFVARSFLSERARQDLASRITANSLLLATG